VIGLLNSARSPANFHFNQYRESLIWWGRQARYIVLQADFLSLRGRQVSDRVNWYFGFALGVNPQSETF